MTLLDLARRIDSGIVLREDGRLSSACAVRAQRLLVPILREGGGAMSHTDVTLDQLRWPQVQVTCWPDGSALDGVDRNRSRSTT